MTSQGRWFIFFLWIAAAMLTACEGNTTRVWKVRNNSEKIIKVKPGIQMNYFSNSDTIYIQVGKIETIGMNDQMGSNPNPGNPTDFIDSLFITNDTNDSLLKDIMADSNWMIRSEERNKVPSDYLHEFILELTYDDFQP